MRALVHRVALFTRGMTLGVRLLVLTKENQILLVRHTYLPGWYLPGGGVDGGETLEQAAFRELEEEAGIKARAPLVLLGMFLNKGATNRDHVALYLVQSFEEIEGWQARGMEIAEVSWFALDALPEGITPATRRRISEYLGKESVDAYW